MAERERLFVVIRAMAYVNAAMCSFAGACVIVFASRGQVSLCVLFAIGAALNMTAALEAWRASERIKRASADD